MGGNLGPRLLGFRQANLLFIVRQGSNGLRDVEGSAKVTLNGTQVEAFFFCRRRDIERSHEVKEGTHTGVVDAQVSKKYH